MGLCNRSASGFWVKLFAFLPLQPVTLDALSTVLYKRDLKRTSRGHLLAFSMTNQLYLVPAWGKVYKERQYLLSDQLENQTNLGGA